MKKEFTDYIESIGMKTKVLKDEVNRIYNEIVLISPEKPETIFVDEYMDSDGIKNYQCVNFFSSHYHMTADNFLSQDSRYAVYLMKNIFLGYTINKSEYNLKKANAKSNINIKVYMMENQSATLKASGKNCESALLVLKKYIIPNLGIFHSLD